MAARGALARDSLIRPRMPFHRRIRRIDATRPVSREPRRGSPWKLGPGNRGFRPGVLRAFATAIAALPLLAAGCQTTVVGSGAGGGGAGDVDLGQSFSETCACGAGGSLDSLDLLVAVNRQSALAGTFQAPMVVVPETYRSTWNQMRPLALGYFIEMADAARAQIGRTILVGSAYRSFCTQCALFQSYADKFGSDYANTFSAHAGNSEHQLGTALDIHDPDGTFIGGSYDIPGVVAADPPLATWLDQNAWVYGFVNSYPENDADGGDRFASRTFNVTGYIPEPWHWRFVGKRAALVAHLIAQRIGLRLSSDELIRSLDDPGMQYAGDVAAAMQEAGFSRADLEAPHPDDAEALQREADAASGGAGGGGAPGCSSQTLGRTVASGECVQVSYPSCGLDTCAWFQCQGSQWVCTTGETCPGVAHPNASCPG